MRAEDFVNDTDPVGLLREERARARELRDPCANLCTLASIDTDGFPQARTLVLRDLDTLLGVFINRTSPKWSQLIDAPVSLVVWLPTLQVQYRLQCTTEEIPQELVHDSWHLRPDAPKRMDWFYTLIAPQSSPLSSRSKLLDSLARLELAEPLTPPASAHGLYLHPEQIERLHLGQDNGIHDRQHYSLQAGVWSAVTLVP